MRINAFSDNNSVGIDGEISKEYDLSFLPDNWDFLVYDDDGEKKITFLDGSTQIVGEEIKTQILAEQTKLKEKKEQEKKEAEEAAAEQAIIQEKLSQFLKQDENGEWVRDYDRKWADVKQKRNEGLTATDVYMMEDFPMEDSKKATLREIRTILRDISDSGVDPFDASFEDLLNTEQYDLFKELTTPK